MVYVNYSEVPLSIRDIFSLKIHGLAAQLSAQLIYRASAWYQYVDHGFQFQLMQLILSPENVFWCSCFVLSCLYDRLHMHLVFLSLVLVVFVCPVFNRRSVGGH